jgi:hypothetical protein
VEGAEEPLTYDLTMSDYTVQDASWLPFPEIAADPQRPVSRFAPLVDWSVSQSYALNAVGDVSGVIIAGDERQELSYGPIRIGPVVNGMLESFEYGAIVSTQDTQVPNAQGEMVPATLTLRYGPSRGRNIDAKPLAALLTGTGAGDGPQTMIGSTVLESLSAEGGDVVSMSFGENRIEDVTVDPSAGPLMEDLDSFVLAIQRGEEPDPQEAIDLLMNSYGAFAVGTYSLSDIDIAGQGFTASMGQILMEGLSAAGMDLMAVRGTDIETPAGSGALGAFELADLTFPDRDAIMTAVMADMMDEEPPIDVMMEAIPTLGRITVEGLDMTTPMTGPLSLGLLETRLADFIGAIPTSARLTVEALEMPLALLPDQQTVMILEALGADPLRADASLSLDWDADTETARLDETASVASVGGIDAEAAVTGIPRDVFLDPQRAGELAATAGLLNFSATFRDDGVTQFVLGMIAEQSGLTPQQFADGLVQQARMQAEMMTGDGALAGRIADSVATFLNDPQSITVAADPGAPLPFAQIMGAAMTAPNRLSDLLNLSITANETAAQ